FEASFNEAVLKLLKVGFQNEARAHGRHLSLPLPAGHQPPRAFVAMACACCGFTKRALMPAFTQRSAPLGVAPGGRRGLHGAQPISGRMYPWSYFRPGGMAPTEVMMASGHSIVMTFGGPHGGQSRRTVTPACVGRAVVLCKFSIADPPRPP